jgi:peptide deformylase
MFEQLQIIKYPDPRLRRMSAPVTEFDPRLKDLAARMLELMRESRGVGLAAPQVGENIRMFVMNATGEEGHDRVYVNPVLSEARGRGGEEGCLSLPNINAKVWRSKTVKMRAQDLDGQRVRRTCDRLHRAHLAARDRSPERNDDHRPDGARRAAGGAAGAEGASAEVGR